MKLEAISWLAGTGWTKWHFQKASEPGHTLCGLAVPHATGSPMVYVSPTYGAECATCAKIAHRLYAEGKVPAVKPSECLQTVMWEGYGGRWTRGHYSVSSNGDVYGSKTLCGIEIAPNGGQVRTYRNAISCRKCIKAATAMRKREKESDATT